MPKDDQITLKNTKAALFAAYEEMRKKYEQARKEELPLPKQEAQRKEEAKILEKTAGYTPESIEDEISQLSQNIEKSLESKKKQLVESTVKLNEIREAIKIENAKLEEVYSITLAADALQTLISDYDLREQELQTSIEQKQKAWEREQEEYAYNLKISRRQDQDEYERSQAKKKADWQAGIDQKEQELQEREEELNARQKETEDMRQQIQDFPVRLERKIKEAKEAKEKALKKDFATEKQLFQQKHESEKGILQVKISNFEEIIKTQSAEVVSLKQSAFDAHNRAQLLATTVVESASVKRQQEEERREREEKREKEKSE